MRTKHLFVGALALPLMFAGCADDTYLSENAGSSQILTGETIELPENFTLVGVKADDGASTRTAYFGTTGGYVLGWAPVDTNSDVDITTDDLNTEDAWDKIGLAWLNETPGSKIYTNYKFIHNGWLESGATSAEFDECDDSYPLVNGIWYNGTDKFVTWNGSSTTTVNYFDGSDSNFEFEESNFNTAGVDHNRGIFHTDNSTIFSGDYLVYYPYNSSLKDIGYLTATAGDRFTNTGDATSGQDYQGWMGSEFFLAGRAQIEGGTQTTDFTLGQLSGMIAVNLKSATNSDISNIKEVVLYSPKGGFYTSVPLDASKIQNYSSMSLGTDLYINDGTATTTKTLISTAYDASNGITVPANNNSSGVTFGFVALPTTIDDLVIMVIDKESKSVVAEWNNETIEVKPNNWVGISATIQAPSDEVLYAYDEDSFASAVTIAYNSASADNPVTIKVIGEVELTSNYTIKNYVTIEAAEESDKLIIAAQKSGRASLYMQKSTNLLIDVDIEGRGCCGLTPGQLTLNGNFGSAADTDYTINNYGGTIAIGTNASSTNKVTNTIYGTINNTVDPEDEGENAGTITIGDYTTVSLYGVLNNEGTVTVGTETGTGVTGNDGTLNIYGTLSNDNLVTVYGNLMTSQNAAAEFNNNDTFVVKVGAQITGNGVTYQADDAEYICEVDNNGTRYAQAIDGSSTAVHRTTTVRFISGSSTQTYTVTGDIKNKDGNLISFEVAVNDNDIVILSHEVDNNGDPLAARINDLSVVSGGLRMTHGELTVSNFIVDHQEETSRGVVLTEKLTVENDVNIIKFNSTSTANLKLSDGITVGGTMTVTDTGSYAVEFNGTSTIGDDMVVEENGSVIFELNTITNIAENFLNDGTANLKPATTTTSVAAVVTCKYFSNEGNTSHWINGSYPTIVK